MARRFIELVFDDFIFGTTSAFSSQRFDELLGSVSRLGLHVVTDKVTGTLPTLSVLALHGANGRNLNAFTTGSTPEIDRATLSTTATTVLYGAVDYVGGPMRYVRLQLTLGGTNPGAKVRVYATGRDRA